MTWPTSCKRRRTRSRSWRGSWRPCSGKEGEGEGGEGGREGYGGAGPGQGGRVHGDVGVAR